MGAGTAAACAARRPDLVRGCVLEDPPWMNQGPAAPAQGPGRQEMYEHMQSLDVEALIAGARRDSPLGPGHLVPWAEAKNHFNVRIGEL